MPSTTSSRLISSVSSFDYLSSPSAHSRSGSSDSSDSYISISDEASSEDEILLSFSEVSSAAGIPSPAISQGAPSPNTFSDDDYVVFGGARTPERRFESFAAGGSAVANVDSLTETLAQLEIRQRGPRPSRQRRHINADAHSDTASVSVVSQAVSTRRRKKRRNTVATARDVEGSSGSSDAAARSTPPSPAKSKKSKKAKKRKASNAASSPKSSTKSSSKAVVPLKAARPGLGERPIVDDVSEAGDQKVTAKGYEEAVEYVTSVLADPSPKTNSNLTYLQALIVELGLCPGATFSVIGNAAENLPRSLRAAKALIKSQAFLNVRDYLAVRHRGLDALRSIMHPNRKSLQNDIRGKRKSSRRVPVEFVKQSGLGVFLVTCYRN